MASYPSIPFELDSSREPINFTVLNVTAAGNVRGRNVQTAEPFEFHAIHRYITKAEADSIYSIWQTNKTAVISLAWKDGNSYNVVFKQPPKIERMRGNWWMAEAWMVGGL